MARRTWKAIRINRHQSIKIESIGNRNALRNQGTLQLRLNFNRYNLINSTFTRISPNEERSKYIPQIVNGENIFRHISYFAPQIIDIEILPGGECIGIPRGSFWLKIFQRKFRNILKKRDQKVRYYRCIKNFMNRELGVSARINVA